MSSMSSAPLRLSPLGRQSMAQLVARARELGVAPEEYASTG